MRDKIAAFLDKKADEIKKLGEFYPDKKSFFIDFMEVEAHDTELAEKLIEEPDEVLEMFEGIINEMDIPTVIDNPYFHVRFTNLPKEKGYSVMVRDITSDYIGRFLSVEGIVNKISDVRPKVVKAMFVCNKCGEQNPELQTTRYLVEPFKCKNCGIKGNFRFISEMSDFIDTQKLEIQEPLEILKGGEQARRIEVWAEDDITDVVTAGDRVNITGTVRLNPPKLKGAVYFQFLDANHIEGLDQEFEDIVITEDEEKQIKKLAKDPKIYDKIISSIAPSIWGYREVKESIALQIFGGRAGKKLPDGTSVRPDIHLLLIGDPGVAKSRLLQYVDQIAPKSIYVTGKGTTGAGLTATAEKDEFAEGAWTLKAGALVLAGGGVACIDEFDKMSKEDRSAMHEALEQQTISVAKAGIIAKFKANTSVLAAANPKFSRFDTYKPISEQFDIPPTLMSRFDLIFPIRDIIDRETDRKIAEHMLKMHKTEGELQELKPEIETDLFRKYISYARRNIFPLLTEEAAEKLKEFYVSLRAMSSGGTAAATPRQLEALVRLAEASAKIRLSNVVTISDAERAVNLTNFVLREIAYDAQTGEFDIDRIVTSYPKSTRDRIRNIDEVIRKLIEESADGTTTREDILAQAAERGIDKNQADQIIQELKKKGDIYEPRHGKFMLTEE
ncbi:MAG: minichromosome maintenance protein MCM [Candidatus Altiarchaeota archaeon]